MTATAHVIWQLAGLSAVHHHPHVTQQKDDFNASSGWRSATELGAVLNRAQKEAVAIVADASGKEVGVQRAWVFGWGWWERGVRVALLGNGEGQFDENYARELRLHCFRRISVLRQPPCPVARFPTKAAEL